jgi:hypothetical protein
MRLHHRSLVAMGVAAVALVACVDTTTSPATKLSPSMRMPEFARIKATDSLMNVTDIVFSDTALVLKRLTPLDSNISISAVIGPKGGAIKINDAGGKIDIPAGALSQETTITMTALAGPNVAYEFQPHGLTFAAPVKIQQDLRYTWASVYPQLLGTAHGGYYDQSLDSSFVDPGKLLVKLKEHELGYIESNATQLKFYVNHFSGYLVTCGRGINDGGR